MWNAQESGRDLPEGLLVVRKLTVGTLTCEDHDGLFFTLQSIRMFHPEVLDEIEFLVLDNRPGSAHGKCNENLSHWIKEPIRYVPLPDGRGTSERTRIFDMATTPYVLCLDSHVLLVPGSLRRLIDYFDGGKDDGNLLQGPLVYDDLKNISTHFEPVWRDQMWGIWATDERGKGEEPFEIPAQGLGVFACRMNSWLGFNHEFRGFGGEECYIHEKFRQAGRRTMCLPWLKWLHRFGRPAGVAYPLRTEDRIRNYLIGHAELGLDPAPVIEHFTPIVGIARIEAMLEESKCIPSSL